MAVFLAGFMGSLKMDGKQSSIVFDNSARLTTSCPNAPPPPPLKPSVTRMTSAATAYGAAGADMHVDLRLSDVLFSCAGASPLQPCILPLDDLDVPSFYCYWNTSAASSTVGPFRGTLVTLPGAANVSANDLHGLALFGQAGLGDIAPLGAEGSLTEEHPFDSHLAHLSWANLKCPLPPDSDIASLLPAGSGDLELHVSWFVAADKAAAVHLPFASGVNKLTISSIAPPPSPPPPNPPPAPLQDPPGLEGEPNAPRPPCLKPFASAVLWPELLPIHELTPLPPL